MRAGPAEVSLAERRRFYGRAAWRRCRAAQLRAEPLCMRCLAAGRSVGAVHVHHITDLAEAPGLAYAAFNLESLCVSCHSKETRYRQVEGAGEDGEARA